MGLQIDQQCSFILLLPFLFFLESWVSEFFSKGFHLLPFYLSSMHIVGQPGLCTLNTKTSMLLVWCGVVWCGVVWCGVVWCGVVWCGVVWCGVVWCGVVWCGVVWCGVVWCGVVWCGVVRVGVKQEWNDVNPCPDRWDLPQFARGLWRGQHSSCELRKI